MWDQHIVYTYLMFLLFNQGEGGKISQLTVKQRTIEKERKGHV